eukprot:scaffold10816_cov149-Skeletonema_dohrnii-CCMP3373.AAC.15
MSMTHEDEKVMSVRSSIFSYADSIEGNKKGASTSPSGFPLRATKNPPPQKAFLLCTNPKNNEH